MAREISVLMVCLGNICRSPMAEGVFRNLLQEEGLDHRIRVDSAGTGSWHVGESPDLRSARTAARHGIALEGSARQVQPGDFRDFDYIVAMDESNLENLERFREGADGEASLHLLREFDPQGGHGAEVPDPYYGGPGGFEDVFEMVERSCRGLLDHILAEERDG
ncbi:MAG: low molecular weight protein-tyrosine-phosphatase [Longimicrobiales bacterium]